MSPHFCRVGKIKPNLGKLISLKEFESKIENKYYTLFSKDIKVIKNNQLNWFDSVDSNGFLDLNTP